MRNRQDARLLLAFSLALGLSLGGCDGDDGAPPPVDPEVERSGPDLRLIVLTDLKGYLAPCGCTSRPLGGIDRTASRIAELRADDVPTLLVAAGDTLFGEALPGPDGAEQQEAWKAEALREILDELQLLATTPGPRDFSTGVVGHLQASRGSRFAWLAAGLGASPPDSPTSPIPADNQGIRLQSSIMSEIGGRRVGLVGISDLADPGGALPEGLAQDAEPVSAGRAAVESLRTEGAEIVIVLAQGSRRFLRTAAGIEGADFVVQGGLDQDEALPPSQVGDRWLLHAGRQGQGLLVVDLHLDGQGEWTDASPWSREAAAERARAECDALRTRIAGWENAGDVNPADLATQRERLARMETDLETLGRAPERGVGRRFVARWEEISPDVAPSPEVSQRIGAYDRRVNDHNREAFADWSPPPAAPGEAHYVGSAACESCHQEAYVWWQGHPHGRAYATLQARHKEYDLSCVGCHVTGYGRPGGSTVTQNLDGALVNVGCEVCHGPGSAHVEAPETAQQNFRAEASERVCVGCHNEEHSDLFDYTAYRGRLLVPGHGLQSP